jgi:hypothetical protein
MSEAPTSRRRWLRFSLRTLFVVVTVLCVWLGYELNWIRQRHHFADSEATAIAALGIPMADPHEYMAPWPLPLFGEIGKMNLTILAEGANDKTLTKRDKDRIAEVSRLFPEVYTFTVMYVEKTDDGYAVDLTDTRYPLTPSHALKKALEP